MRTQFAVVGGGLTGLATAWALLRRGHAVILAEQAQVGHRDGGSHGSCRIFRLGYEDPHYVTLAARARELWTELERACGQRLLHPVPQLTFGPLMAQVHDAMAAAGAACELLPAQEAAARFPGILARGQVLLEPASAVIAADRALTVLEALARRDGVVLPGARVTSLADDGRRVRVTVEPAGTGAGVIGAGVIGAGVIGAGVIEADCAIVCAGPWTAGLLATTGIRLPGSATLEQVAYLEPAGAAREPMPIFVHYGGEFPYGLPVPGSPRYKIGLHHGGPAVAPDHQDHGADAGLAARIEGTARAVLPGFDPKPAAVERCVYDNSPDGDFVVDRIGNVVIGSGTSGHGFKFGPLLGEWLAFLATSDAGPVGAPPARFALSRF